MFKMSVNYLHVISGSARGLKLWSPVGYETRPTTGRVKEAVFNILNAKIDFGGTVFLDLYAGSGAMGIEALSRNADFAVFVDSAKECCDVVKKNIAKARFIKKSVVYNDDAMDVLAVLKKQFVFDVIYLDPPYDYAKKDNYLGLLLDQINKNGLLSADGICVLETSVPKGAASPIVEYEKYGFCVIDERNYSNTSLVFLNKLSRKEASG